MPEHVNNQITDAVTQTNVKVVAEAPAMAMGSVYQTAAHSTGLMFENAVNAQSQQFILAQTATTQGVMQIYSLDTIADAIAIARMLQASANT
ncbi:MAG: RebB family R body protein [Bacteroidota bacterium]